MRFARLRDWSTFVAFKIEEYRGAQLKVEPTIPGLFMVGVARLPVFGPIMRFMYGAKHVAPALARLIGRA